MITNEQTNLIKEIAFKATNDMIDNLEKCNFNLSDTYRAALICSALIAASIISSLNKNADYPVSVAITDYVKSIIEFMD